jgi:hypothetical protein
MARLSIPASRSRQAACRDRARDPRYPLVVYLMKDVPCTVRIRNTRTNILWQMDFCKITRVVWEPGGNAGYRWIGTGGLLRFKKMEQGRELY